MLRRRQCFEFCDQAWFKGWMREAYLDCLTFVHRTLNPFHHLVAPLATWATRGGAADKVRVLDLASGSGEQVAMVIRMAERQCAALPQFILSDIYPQVATWTSLQPRLPRHALAFLEQPFSALDIQYATIRHWSIFTAFHHFAPEAAQQILKAVANEGDSLCIVENLRRRWLDLVLMVLGFPLHLIVPFVARDFKWQKLFVTSIIPVIPLMVAFDGVVSVLRAYTKQEIIDLLPPDQRFDIEYHEAWWRFCPLKATMLTLTKRATSQVEMQQSEPTHAPR